MTQVGKTNEKRGEKTTQEGRKEGKREIRKQRKTPACINHSTVTMGIQIQ